MKVICPEGHEVKESTVIFDFRKANTKSMMTEFMTVRFYCKECNISYTIYE